MDRVADPAAGIAAALRPIHWPIPTEAEALLDGLLAFGLGLLAALLFYGLARLILARREDPRAALLAELAGSRRLDPAERLLTQARLAARLPETAPARRALAEALYRPEPAIDLDATDAALARALEV